MKLLASKLTIMTAAITVGIAAGLAAQNSTVPGEVSTPFPTLTNLALEWLIKGDDNLNAAVTVDYRLAGEEAWHAGMPLRRIPAGKSRGTQPIFLWENKFSGSLFDLRPGAEYEIRLRLSDPDGGKAEKVVRATTRGVPRPAPDGQVKKVSPETFENAALEAKPGDILLLSPGYYEDFTLRVDGAPGRPIVIRSDHTHPVINSTFDRLNLRDRRHVILEGLMVNGSVDLLGADDISVRYCKVNAKFGIIAEDPPGCSNCYIADNEVTYVMPWVEMGLGCCLALDGTSACVGEGIELTGPGNVICYNRVRGYRDCLSIMEDLHAYNQVCIDFYNNDVYVGADDGIEADFSMGNCRIMRNRLTNCGIALSSQPGLGGPTYFIRNVMYNILFCTYKLARGSTGDVVLHNTAVKVGDGFQVVHNPSRAYFRNNLSVGGTGGRIYGRYSAGNGLAISFLRANETCDMDYDGVGTYGTPFKGLVGKLEFNSLAELRKLTSEKHAVQVGLDAFKAGVEFPDPPVPERLPPNLSLKEGSPAVDAGLAIPNINDNFSGQAPDLGAYELGSEKPHYGPRPAGVDEETEWIRLHGK